MGAEPPAAIGGGGSASGTSSAEGAAGGGSSKRKRAGTAAATEQAGNNGHGDQDAGSPGAPSAETIKAAAGGRKRAAKPEVAPSPSAASATSDVPSSRPSRASKKK